MNIYCGNVRSKSLSSIVNSPILKMMRSIGSNIQGYCKECKYYDVCYGCRAIAYALTGDALESDPLCWHSINEPQKGNKNIRKRDDA